MKRGIIITLALVICFGISQKVWADASVAYTRHNLGTTHRAEGSPGNNFLSSGTPNVCVFCHTPHGSQSWDNVKAPIWNKGSGAASYQMYQGSPTLDSTPQDRPTGVSLACLTCHDGTAAMDTMLNAPGSGWRTATPGSPSRALDASGAAYVWSSSPPAVGADGRMPSTSVPNLGTDLRNDHPISMRYAGTIGGFSARDPKFFPAVIVRAGKVAAIDNPQAGMYRGGSEILQAGNVTDGDIRLFNVGTSGGTSNDTAAQNYEVQCASCHNPHGTDCGTNRAVLATTGDTDDCEAQTGAYYTFLQRTNKASRLCRACHIK